MELNDVYTLVDAYRKAGKSQLEVANVLNELNLNSHLVKML